MKTRISKASEMSIHDYSHSAVVRFCGNSGDGIQLLGTEFASITAQSGHDFYTLADFPAEIRAPAGTEFGVSAFQIHFGQKKINTAGEEVDVLFAFNPAALKTNLSTLKQGGILFVDVDSFKEREWQKVGYTSNPILQTDIKKYQLIEVTMTTHVLRAAENLGASRKDILKARNYWALGVSFFLFQNDEKKLIEAINKKFSYNKELCTLNKTIFQAGYAYGETFDISYYPMQKKSHNPLEKGAYKSVNGIDTIVYGLMSVAASTQLKLLFYSYPITPASLMLHKLSALKGKGIQVFQVEDEIAAITMAIGSSFAGALGITATSGPGLSLMAEGLGLAIAAEMPLIVFDIQRSGPSTGMPTKTSQSDLNIALYGRHGEAPCVVLAPATVEECFEVVRTASQIAIKYMLPVIILADAHLANSMQPWKVPDVKTLKEIDLQNLHPTRKRIRKRDQQTLAMPWNKPSDPDTMYVTGGLERHIDGTTISYDPENHKSMTQLRAEKVRLAANDLPLAKTCSGNIKGDILLMSWGSSFGATDEAVRNLQDRHIDVTHLCLFSLSPLPENLYKLMLGFKKIIVVEANSGQLAHLLRGMFLIDLHSCTKTTGTRITVKDIIHCVENIKGDL